MFTGVGQENGTWTPLQYFAQWNGSVWSGVGGAVNAQVFALATNGASLYAGGFFSQATQSNGSNVTVNAIARWNGTTWTNLGLGLTAPSGYPYVATMTFLGSDLYVGGDFTGAGGTNANFIARWNGRWFPLGNGASNGVDNVVQSLLAKGGNLYVGGSFSTAKSPSGTLTASAAAIWNGTQWSTWGRGTGGGIYSITSYGTNVIAAGLLYGATQTDLHKVTSSGIASWDGTRWSGLGPGQGLGDIANAIAVAGTNFYVGGTFAAAGKVTAGGLAVWNGTTWTQVGAGMGGTVYALATEGTNLYAGGTYLQVSQTNSALLTVNRITRWGGSQWSALGQGVNDMVFAVATSGSNVYVGGRFIQATQTGGGTVNASMIARWNGTSWSALGSGTGLGVSVNAIAVAGSNEYVGGEFKQIGGVNATNLARWDGVAWAAVGGGLQAGAYPTVRALLSVGNDLYVAGSFLRSGGGVSLNDIARWDGTNWFPLGTGTYGTINAIALSHDVLFAAGYLTSMDGSPAPGVARWDGANWTSMGSGVTSLGTPAGSALGILGTSVYVAGSFVKAGGYQAYNFARWTDPAPAPQLHLVAATNRTLKVQWPVADSDYALQRTGSMAASNIWRTVTNAATTNGGFRVVTMPATNPVEFFRLSK
jgi:hypothetical protein